MTKLILKNMSELEDYLTKVKDHYFRPHWTIGRYTLQDSLPFYYNNYNGNDREYRDLSALVDDLQFSFPMEIQDQRQHELTTELIEEV